MKRTCRSFAAFTLTLAMVLTPLMSVSAETEEGGGTGTGRVEGCVETDVYQVILPTVSSHTFDFIIDPLGLISQTNGAGYNGKTFEKESTLFFRRTDKEKKTDYSSISNPITITNRGSIPIDVSLRVRMDPSSLAGIRMTADREFAGDNSASLYMAVLDGEKTMPVGMDGVDITATLDAAPEAAFEYGYDKERGRYTYELKKNLNVTELPARSFQITGEANGKGNWSQYTEAVPKIKIAWEITRKEDIGD